MGDRLSQHDRLFYFNSPLGEDKFLVRALEGEEEISSLFRFQVELLSDDPYIDETALLGKTVTLAIRQADATSFRYFNGRVSWFRYAGPEGSHTLYRAEIVPWTWLLTQTSDCNVRQGKSVPDIVGETFRRYGFSGDDFTFTLHYPKRYTPWEFSVQYRESAFGYASRLLESEGIFYFYRQTRKGHQMVLADDNTACEPCPYQSRFRMDRVHGPGVTRVYDTIFTFDLQRHLRSGRYIHRDFNFIHPDPRHLHADAASRSQVAVGKSLEVFDYPGEYEEPDQGRDWARLRMETEEAREEVFEGTGNARSLTPGFRFELSGHERREWNRAYIVTRVVHSGQEAGVEAAPDAAKPYYQNSFCCIPASIPYRPQEKTEKATVTGPQTAIVVGPKNEEIYIDKYGRIRVKFHWDYSDKQGDDCSFWIRVAHSWAGSNWGAFFLPRVGQEVLVDFLEGDPDRPIVIGRVYNSDLMPPWPLPSKKNISGIRTRSTKGGGPNNYNEISFDDTKGEELFALHAEKDFRLTVENDETDIIDRDRFVTVKRDHVEAVQRHLHENVGENASRRIGGTLDEQTGGQHTEKIGGSRHTSIGGDWRASVGGHVSVEFGTGAAAKSGGQLLLHTEQGMFARDDSQLLLESGGQLTLKGPGGFITINSGGVYIQGSMIYLNSGGSALSYPGSSPVTIDKPADPLRPPGLATPVPFVSLPSSALPQLPALPALPVPAPSLLSSVADAASARLPELPQSLQRDISQALDRVSSLAQISNFAPLAQAALSDSGAPAGYLRLTMDALPPQLANVPFRDALSGFSSSLFENPQHAVLAFRHPDPASSPLSSSSLHAGALQQMRESQSALAALAAQDLFGQRLSFTGHGDAAPLAEAAALATSRPATSFNPTTSSALPPSPTITRVAVRPPAQPGSPEPPPPPTAQLLLPAVDELGAPVTWIQDFASLQGRGMDFIQNGLKAENSHLLELLSKVL
ncbi:MAG: type VI secretion system tip protein VgrG [Acidobacteria bacterium]|nr:type VI secretion system tip protein VgrG [Acidobacteriota bacterium]